MRLRSRQAEQQGRRDPDGEAAATKELPSQQGQVVPLMAALVVFVGVLSLAVVHLGVGAAQRSRAQSAADAAALAAAAETTPARSETAAEALATANGGRLVDMRRRGIDVLVTVQIGRARATARARPRLGRSSGP